jgi:hypothetical protein
MPETDDDTRTAESKLLESAGWNHGSTDGLRTGGLVAPLNNRQHSTLQLIRDGDDLSGDDRVGLRISARSLASRGLVKVRRADGKWQALITEAGRRYLDHPRPTEAEPIAVGPRTPSRQRRTSAANSSTKLTGRRRTATLPDVPVPERLHQLHTVVAALREDTAVLVMPKDLRHRSLLLLQAVTTAAIARGWQVSDRSSETPPHHHYDCSESGHREGWVWVLIDSFSYRVNIDQEFPQTLDPVKSKSLEIELPRSKSGIRWQWADRKTGTLEDRLPEVLEGLACRATEDRARAAEAARATAEREVAREKAETDAHARALSQFYADSLYRQVEAFEHARAISTYCDALEQQIKAAEVPEPDLERATTWLAWARTHATEIDPFRTLPTMPKAPEFAPKELEAFVKGSDRLGPERKSIQESAAPPQDSNATWLHLPAQKSFFRR